MKPVTIALVISVAVNGIGIPWLLWELAGVRAMYRRNVDYCSELAYAVGYHKAKGNDLEQILATYPTRLPVTRVEAGYVEASIWPARNQYIRIGFGDETDCSVSIVAKDE